MRASLALALLLAFALAGAASAADAPFLQPEGGCGLSRTATDGLALPGADLLPPAPQARLFPLCPGPSSCPSGCTPAGGCTLGPISVPAADCCVLTGGALFCCDQDQDQVWALTCRCEGEGTCEEFQEVTLSCGF